MSKLPLEPTAVQWRELVETLKDFLESEIDGLPSMPTNLPDTTDPLVQLPHPDADPEDLQVWLRALFHSGFNTAHPAFMAYIPGGGLVTAALAEWVIKTMNRYGTAYFAAPLLASLELRVIATFAKWVGFPSDCGGVLTTGGSLANFTAVVTARRAKLPENFLDGVMYCSDQTHHSVMKAANLAGFSSRNIRLIETLDMRLNVDALRMQIARDRADGLTPFMVVASAGTTNTGVVDPLQAVAEVCHEEDLWCHVDAAYGGFFMLTERGRTHMGGIAQADSITLDPHKGMFLPYGTGCILVKERDALIEAHEMRGDYMPQADRERVHLDPFSLSVELSREHRGLKVWLPLMLHGEDAFRNALNEKLDLAQHVYEALEQMPELDVLAPPTLSVVAFRVNASPDEEEALNRKFLETLNAGQRVYVSPTLLQGRLTQRIAILSHRTHAPQIETLLAEIKRVLAEL